MVELLKHILPHMCYHAQFGRSPLKGVGINTGEPQGLGSDVTPHSWNGGDADPKIHAPAHMLLLVVL